MRTRTIPIKALIMTILLSVSAAGQTAVFKWEDVLCSYTGTYDTRKYSAREIGDTYKLVELSGIPLQFRATVWKYEEIAGLDVAALDAEYKQRREELLALKPVKLPFWEKARQARLLELDQYYRLASVTARAYTDPQVLRTHQGAESCKLKYAEPIIAGGDRLVDAWRVVNRESQAKNSDPARLQRIWNEHNASPDRLKFALVETMSFGWWNCANDTVQYVASDGTWEKEFKKLFIRVRGQCDEP